MISRIQTIMIWKPFSQSFRSLCPFFKHLNYVSLMIVIKLKQKSSYVFAVYSICSSVYGLFHKNFWPLVCVLSKVYRFLSFIWIHPSHPWTVSTYFLFMSSYLVNDDSTQKEVIFYSISILRDETLAKSTENSYSLNVVNSTF